ncbi:MAG: hypothetical protein BWY28_02823 [bacterium ADurb.Bin236]|nr:MAG: hypothetical protein BWY28_02823 [bacterium ADurb.Bin236]
MINDKSPTAKEADALYLFLEMRIFMQNFKENELLYEKCNGKLAIRDGYFPAKGTFVHEYTHYIQNVTTTFGISILLKWIQIIFDFLDDYFDEELIAIPLIKNNPKGFTDKLQHYLGQCDDIIGCKEQFLFEIPNDVRQFSIYCDDNTLKRYMIMPHDKEGRFGIPLGGNVFIESMAKGAKLLLRGQDTVTKSDFGKWPIKRGQMPIDVPHKTLKDLYYNALFRFIKTTFKAANPLFGTVVISDACLMAKNPGQAFEIAIDIAKGSIKDSSDPNEWIQFREMLSEIDCFKNGTESILNELDQKIIALEDATLPRFEYHICEFLRLCRRAINIRRVYPALFSQIILDDRTFQGLVEEIGCPPIMFSDSQSFIKFYAEEWLSKAYFLFIAFYWVIFGMTYGVFSYDGKNKKWNSCLFYYGNWCSFKKGSYCKNRFPYIEPDNGKVCVMGYVAEALGMRKKRIVVK